MSLLFLVVGVLHVNPIETAENALGEMTEGRRMFENSSSGVGWGGGGGMGFGGGGMGGGGGFGGGVCVFRLYNAYVAMQAWKKAITDDPQGITKTWVGRDVCNYTGVFCVPALDKPCDKVVAGIDLNHGNLKGSLVEELGLLTDIALFHLNSNRFSGTIPVGFKNLHLLAELDVSNNQLSGNFPTVVLELQSLIYLDLRFNFFVGNIPAELFNKKQLDAIFVNNNYFEDKIPDTVGNSLVSVVSFANNKLTGSIPSSIGNMAQSLNEVLFLNNTLCGCLPEETGMLDQLIVLDVSFNHLGGQVPVSLGCLGNIEQLILARNEFYGFIPDVICSTRSLQNLSVSYNYFTAEGRSCPSLPSRGVPFDDSQNCIPGRPFQRSQQDCAAFSARPKTCIEMASPHVQCGLPPSISPPPPLTPLRYPSPPPPQPKSPPPPIPLRYPSPPPPTPLQVPAIRYASPPPPALAVPAIRYASPPPPALAVPAIRYASPPPPPTNLAPPPSPPPPPTNLFPPPTQNCHPPLSPPIH